MQIGQTPLIRLERMAPPNGAEIWVKWKGANPTGSMKDRMALSMILGAERRMELTQAGRARRGLYRRQHRQPLAMVCAARGYTAHFVSSDAFSEEKLQTMRAFGARLDVVPSEGGKVTAGSFLGNAEVFKAKAAWRPLRRGRARDERSAVGPRAERRAPHRGHRRGVRPVHLSRRPLQVRLRRGPCPPRGAAPAAVRASG
jgi:hypothetical protein